MTTTLPVEGTAGELRTRISGRVITPGDDDYANHVLAWNRSYQHQPSIIVIPESAADVAAAVSHAGAAGMAVAVQATGHGVARTADGAMLILTHRLDEVTVDAETWTARIGAGAKWAKVLGPATAAGLAPLLGSTPDVSAVGYTLGGGMGWIARKYGLSADHVRCIEIVTSDGRIRRASPKSERDLFWALRGGGAGSLGVVTAIEIDLVPVESLYAGNLLYPASMAREVAARYREWISAAPEELTSAITLMNFPPVEDVPAPIRGKSFAIVRGAFIGSDAEGEQLLSFWREWKSPELDMWGRIPFAEVATISNDPVDPLAGLATTDWIAELDDQALDRLIEAMFEQDGPSPLTMAEIRHAGGAISREPEHPSAYGNRDHRHLLELVGITMTAEETTALEAFIEEVRIGLRPHLATGAYLNFLEGAEKIKRTSEGFEPDAWERIRRIKSSFDPTNMFRHGIALQ